MRETVENEKVAEPYSGVARASEAADCNYCLASLDAERGGAAEELRGGARQQ